MNNTTLNPTDYALSESDASELKSIVLMPHELRTILLNKYRRKHGVAALINLFSQCVGMANSVVENAEGVLQARAVAVGLVEPEDAKRINLPTLFGAADGAKQAAGTMTM